MSTKTYNDEIKLSQLKDEINKLEDEIRYIKYIGMEKDYISGNRINYINPKCELTVSKLKKELSVLHINYINLKYKVMNDLEKSKKKKGLSR